MLETDLGSLAEGDAGLLGNGCQIDGVGYPLSCRLFGDIPRGIPGCAIAADGDPCGICLVCEASRERSEDVIRSLKPEIKGQLRDIRHPGQVDRPGRVEIVGLGRIDNDIVRRPGESEVTVHKLSIFIDGLKPRQTMVSPVRRRQPTGPQIGDGLVIVVHARELVELLLNDRGCRGREIATNGDHLSAASQVCEAVVEILRRTDCVICGTVHRFTFDIGVGQGVSPGIDRMFRPFHSRRLGTLR